MHKKKAVPSNGKWKGFCFVIMPFGGWFDHYYETIYQPAIEGAGLQPRRADDIFRPSSIVHDIWDFTQKSELILGDLTGKNPNVLYELGLAHAIAKPAVLVTQSLDDVPFDLRSLRILKYDRDLPDWGKELRFSITSSIREILMDPNSSIPPAFLNVRKLVTPTVTAEQKELIALRQDMDALKRRFEMDGSLGWSGAIQAVKEEPPSAAGSWHVTGSMARNEPAPFLGSFVNLSKEDVLRAVTRALYHGIDTETLTTALKIAGYGKNEMQKLFKAAMKSIEASAADELDREDKAWVASNLKARDS